ncbi:MAG: transcription antitermination factor NusB [Candidatus Ryanbacteria bacterium RIFCSPHIGHO2_02_FULL_48_12]|uniref:Transcription antitermination protein NusB n=1 Tax=Candidatus Ryanbacteria bacterium RIFCSPHIGHO2_01_FULL_48_27 TaxID=1802115 RepID=A0A1G2G4M8_9BACT|nr:MAG: transcription antitermination factor NusB [Candidatus Ryanbacteria bacterium RIFCSPHIGHO2_01_FULL_48_27]OGZ49003.1 MAG: transcription antitermination factor NusB [Candidatus Ryanbacteria bacterium RIFCSPHIGHO2_02_FULL_48_12]
MASRHLARSIAMQSLYEWDFNAHVKAKGVSLLELAPSDLGTIITRNIQEFGPGLEDKAFVGALVEGVLENRDKIDTVIEKAAPEWPLEQVAAVDRNILRIGLYELLYGNYKEVPPKVAINEAIELAKTFGGENSGKFINGVLGTVYREIGEPGKDDGPRKDLSPEELAQLPIEQKVGAVVYRKDSDDTYFALVHDVFGYWTLAKGSPEPDEEITAAVVRKIKEEIGVGTVTAEQKLGENEYIAQDPERGKVRRRVTYFLASTPDAELKLKISGGLDDVRWFSAEELDGLTMYDDVRGFFKKALEIIK